MGSFPDTDIDPGFHYLGKHKRKHKHKDNSCYFTVNTAKTQAQAQG